MQKNFLIIMFLMVFYVTGNSQPKNWYVIGKLPGYVEDLYYTGVGEGSSYEEAIAAAQLKVAAQLRVSIKGEVTTLVEEITKNEQISYSTLFQNSIQMVVNETVNGIEVVKKENIKDKYYAFAILDKEKYFSSLKVELDRLSQNSNNFIIDGGKFIENGNIVLGIDNYVDAQEILPQFYTKVAFYNSLSDNPYKISNIVNISEQISTIKQILSNVIIEVVSGNNQTSKVGVLLPEPITISVSFNKKALVNFPIIIKNTDNSIVDKGKTGSDGFLSITLKALPSKNFQNKIVIKPDLYKLPTALRDYLSVETYANYRTIQNNLVEFSISIKDEYKNHLSSVEKKLSRAIAKMGYPISAKALLLLEGVVSVIETQEIEGYNGKQYLTKSELTLFLTIKESNKRVGSILLVGTGLSSKNAKNSIDASYNKLEIKKGKLVDLLAEAEEELTKLSQKQIKE